MSTSDKQVPPPEQENERERNRKILEERLRKRAEETVIETGSGDSDDALEERFRKLKEYLLKNMRSKQIGNIGLEIGRPALEPMSEIRPDLTNIFTMPTIDILIKKGWRPSSTAVATAQQLIEISAKLQGLGVPPESIAPVVWDTAMYCASAGSSDKMDPQGTVEFPGGAITRDSVVATIKEYTTLRAFCRAYAPIVWNYMIGTNQPPANWQAKGFNEQTKFAAFDTFDYIRNPAAIKPLEGLIRSPTNEEMIANATHRQLAIDRNSRNDRFSNNSLEVTGGLYGCKAKRTLRNLTCD
uniref:Capsid protein n=1 Tax=Nerine latent virus TaxID=797075 RepID=A0A8E6YK99_9VIRU|nr:coat protein [Nerine latent virus]